MATLSTIARSWRLPSTTGSIRAPAVPIGQDKGESRAALQLHPPGLFLARTFRNLEDLNTQLQDWLASVANVRQHGTTQRIVAEAFAAERPELQPLPATSFDALLKLERRVSHDGLVSIGGNYYSVPDRTRRIVEVHQLPDGIRILDEGRVVAVHPVLEGRRQYRVDPSHRQAGAARAMRHGHPDSIVLGDTTAPRDLQEAADYYLTPRGQHPNSTNQMLMTSISTLASFTGFEGADTYLTQPVLLVAGSEAGSLWHSQELHATAASKDKELVIIDGATHMDLYDGEGADHAAGKLSPFFTRTL